jgi:DNA-directed RNA polymerase specialized sigma24 family protein
MDTTESAIKSRLFRARKMLADKVSPQSDYDESDYDRPRNTLTEG